MTASLYGNQQIPPPNSSSAQPGLLSPECHGRGISINIMMLYMFLSQWSSECGPYGVDMKRRKWLMWAQPYKLSHYLMISRTSSSQSEGLLRGKNKYVPQWLFSLCCFSCTNKNPSSPSVLQCLPKQQQTQLQTTNCPLCCWGFPSSFSPQAQTLQEGGRASGCSPNNRPSHEQTPQGALRPSGPPSPHERVHAPTECLFEGRGLIRQKSPSNHNKLRLTVLSCDGYVLLVMTAERSSK